MSRLTKRSLLLAKVVLITTFCFTSGHASGQEKKDLEGKKLKTQEEIEYSNKILLETQQNRKSNLQRVRILNSRIQLRNDLIRNINAEIRLIEKEIEQKVLLIAELEKDLEKVKEKYAELIVQAYWNKNRRDWMLFIMSSENFNQAYRRMKYLQQFSRYRREQAGMIRAMQEGIVTEVEKLESIRDEKEKLAFEKKQENSTLELEIYSKGKLVSDLTKREKELKKEIEDKKKIAEKLEKEIAAIIAEEARKSRSKNIYDQLTPDEKLVSQNFQGNRGKLPWPVERGIITSRFGKHPHPVLKQVTVNNDGIDISTVKGATARALFEGEVSKIVSILGANYTIIIRHGNFLTVYQNLIDLKVKQGDYVSVKQILGTIYTDTESSGTVLQLQIWKEKEIQNPEDWIIRN